MRKVQCLLGMCIVWLSGCSKDSLMLTDENKKQIIVEYGESFVYDPQSIGIQAKEMDAITYNEIDLTQLGKQTIRYEYHNEQLQIEVEIVDTTAPQISKKDITIKSDELGLLDELMQISAVDNYDGDISDQIVCESLDVSTIHAPTTINRSCAVKDSSGNVSETSVVIQIEKEDEGMEIYPNGIINGLTVEPHIVENPSSIFVMVNKLNALPMDYAPDDLVDIGDGHQLRQEAAIQYAAMKEKADNDGISLNVLSSYRTKSYQENLFWNYVSSEGEMFASTYSAIARRSEHELGLAVDVGDSYYLDADLDHTATGIWLAENAHNYGFILRYPEDKVLMTQYGFEAWHYRYVGTELALALKDSHLTLEEYYQVVEMNDGNSYRFY